MKKYSAPVVEVIKVDVEGTFASYPSSGCLYLLGMYAGSASDDYTPCKGEDLVFGGVSPNCVTVEHDGYTFG